MKSSDPGKLMASCLILAGGEGRRLTPDKPLLEIDGEPLIGRVVKVVASVFPEVILVTNTPEKYRFLDLPHAGDERPGCGPLMGIFSGLKRIRHDVAFVCGADMPFLREDVIRAEFEEVGGFDVVVPYPGGLPEFLHAYYSRRCLPAMQENLDVGRFMIARLRDQLRIRRLERDWFVERGFLDAAAKAFVNINTLDDYHRWGSGDSGRKRAGQ